MKLGLWIGVVLGVARGCHTKLSLVQNLLDFHLGLAPLLWSEPLQSWNKAQEKQLVLVPISRSGVYGINILDQSLSLDW